MKADPQNIWSGDGVLAAEWQHVSQPDRQSGAGMSQAGLEAVLLSLARWGHLPCLQPAAGPCCLPRVSDTNRRQERL